ncbi:MAG: S8 family peptidase [Bacteroidetes bacterium]|nr:S8 family peptidase [Bacteroidota bacterium]
MKKIFILSTLLLPLFSIAQEMKIPLALYEKASHYAANENIRILVQGNPLEIADAAKKHNGYLVYNEGMICSVCIPAHELVNFSKENGIVRIGNSVGKMQLMNDTIKQQTGLNNVHNGMAPLTQPYKGDNVIMGMIDSGIDFNHPDFKDSNGKTRILYIWDQRDTSGTGPTPWLYGTLWDSAQINNGSCTHNDLQYFGHGTHTSGIAGGNGSSTVARDYSGAAPNVNFVVVALDFNYVYSNSAVADAAEYIYSVAMSLGRPCVINASVGDYYGSHDGQDPEAMMIDTMLNTPGRAFVCAAGNAGNLPIHLSYTLSSDTNLTWFNSSQNIYLQLWADTTNFNSAKFAIGCTQDVSFIDKGRTLFTNIQSNLPGISVDTLKNSAGQRLAIISRVATIQGSAYSMEFLIVQDSSTTYDYSLLTTGSGLFHLWSFDIYTNPLPNSTTYPNIAYYKQTDTTYTLCSSFQCSNRTITVANYVNRDVWMDVNNTWEHDTTVTAGTIMWNSSVGPTRDGRYKPDISAPGANDISCGVISELPAIIAGAPQYVGVGGFHVVDGGTSAASPVVAGSVALYLQLHPNATWQDCKNAVIYCAKQDVFTGSSLPDYTWGYGKIDAFSMMTNCALTTSSTIVDGNEISFYPDPLNGETEMEIHFNAVNAPMKFEIWSTTGALVYSENISPGTSSVHLAANSLAGGIYLVKMSGENYFTAKKIVVE